MADTTHADATGRTGDAMDEASGTDGDGSHTDRRDRSPHGTPASGVGGGTADGGSDRPDDGSSPDAPRTP